MNKYTIIESYTESPDYIFSDCVFFETKQQAIEDARRNGIKIHAILDEIDINILRIAGDEKRTYNNRIEKFIFENKDSIVEEMDFRNWEQ